MAHIRSHRIPSGTYDELGFPNQYAWQPMRTNHGTRLNLVKFPAGRGPNLQHPHHFNIAI
ncbi:TPA: hypothetical protein EYO57_20210 [Candidatus Poribacteria bacterium]|nr:hypothetical protein [Candidatus Poribacteria bacterium]